MSSSQSLRACLGLALVTVLIALPAAADPQSDIRALFFQTNGVAAGNGFNQGERVSLVTKLIGAGNALDRGHEKTAVNELDAFVNEVEALQRSGRLPAEDGQALIDAATAIADQL